jgi:antitoxin component of MazEF toxin-antitoxin module
MPKVYKSNNKLAVYIPYDVITTLGIRDGDDLDFLKYGDNTFLIVKKKDIVMLLAKKTSMEETKPSGKAYAARGGPRPGISLEPEELALLKKLDTLKYSDRTNTKVAAMLNPDEKSVLQSLLKRSIIVPFKKGNEKEVTYSIQKNVYDAFLYRKGVKDDNNAANQPYVKARSQHEEKAVPAVRQKAWEHKIEGVESYTDMLESKGYLVLGNEVEASMVSAALEDSIRQGLVVGTRAFNKKFYIGLRGFVNKHAPKILKIIDQKSMNVEDIAKESGIDEDGARTILYVLSESGDVTEVRRDIFRAA